MSNRFRDDEDIDDDDKPKKPAAKPVPRRSAMKSVGLAAGGVMALAAGGAGYRVYQTGAYQSFTNGPGFDPWRVWQAQVDGPPPKPQPAEGEKPAATAEEPEKNALVGNPYGLIAAGLLASSPHNSQPWRFKIRDRTIDIMADTKRNIGVIDPDLREMTIGLGCCIENMLLGASAVGLQPLLNLLPEGPLGPVMARLTLYAGVGATTKEALALAKRHTNRGPYVRERALDLKTLDTLDEQVNSSKAKLIWLKADTEAARRFAEGTLKATSDFIADKEMVAASDAWARYEQGEHRDGLTLPCVGLTPIKARLAMVLPKALVGNPNQEWLKMTRDVQLATAPLYGLIVVPALDDRLALIEAGRLWQRLHVQATILGLAMQPLSQLMEMVDRDKYMQRPSEAERTLGSLATLSGSAVAFAFRAGYSRYITFPSPRRSIEDVIFS